MTRKVNPVNIVLNEDHEFLGLGADWKNKVDELCEFGPLTKTVEEFLSSDCQQLMLEIRREEILVGFQEAQWTTGGDQSISCHSQIGRGGSGRAYEVTYPRKMTNEEMSVKESGQVGRLQLYRS